MTEQKGNLTVKDAGRLGGLASAKKMTPEQRKARAKKAVTAREAKKAQGL